MNNSKCEYSYVYKCIYLDIHMSVWKRSCINIWIILIKHSVSPPKVIGLVYLLKTWKSVTTTSHLCYHCSWLNFLTSGGWKMRFFKTCIYFLTMLDLCCWSGFSLLETSGGYSLAVMWASHCRGFSHYGSQAPGDTGFRSCNMWVQ